MAARQNEIDPFNCESDVVAGTPPKTLTLLPNQRFVCASVTHLTSFAVLLGGPSNGGSGGGGGDAFSGENLKINPPLAFKHFSTMGRPEGVLLSHQ